MTPPDHQPRELLSATAAHDLKQPINSILLASDVLLRSAVLSTEDRAELARIKHLARRLSRLVDELSERAP